MDAIQEALNAAAALATVAGFLLEAVQAYKQRRMTKEEKERAGGNRL